jgi:hypothetical protein
VTPIWILVVVLGIALFFALFFVTLAIFCALVLAGRYDEQHERFLEELRIQRDGEKPDARLWGSWEWEECA